MVDLGGDEFFFCDNEEWDDKVGGEDEGIGGVAVKDDVFCLG